MKIVIFLFASLLLLSSVTLAAPFEEGEAAYDNGDYQTALKFWRPLADHGDAKAQSRIGMLYECGCGVDQDDATAATWYRKSAEQGNTWSQIRLGAMYETGLGVRKDAVQTIKWWSKAAEGGDGRALRDLGEIYQAGRGVKKDLVQAYLWYSIAGDFGEATSLPLDDISSEMTSEQTTEAKRLVAQWELDHAQLHISLRKHSTAIFLAIFFLPAVITASLKGPQQRFPFSVRVFTWVTFSLLLFMPLFISYSQVLVSPVSSESWTKAITWMLAVLLAALYARKRCGSSQLSYLDGLMFAGNSMMGLWGGTRVIVTIPLLFLMFLGSLSISLFYELIGKPNIAPVRYQKMIGIVYKNRMWQ